MKYCSTTVNILLFCLFWLQPLSSQSCDPPIIAGFSDYRTDGVNIRWNDFFNNDPLGWEIELGPEGFTRTEEATTPLITTESYEVIDLAAATRYEFYIRTVCDQDKSVWNGPFFFSTNIENPSNCNIDLPIDDNKCPTSNIFRIEVSDSPGLLGEDIILEELSLIIEHPWPPDLRVVLRSPSSRAIDISRHIGIGTLDYGEVNPDSCSDPVHFRPDACLSVAGPIGAVRSSLRPIGDFNDFLDGSPANGIWQLEICDRAQGDIGQLKFAGLSFVPQACPLPFFSIVNDIDSDEAVVRWVAPPNCNVIEIEVGPKGFTPGTVVSRQVNCTLEAFTLPNLDPDTEYEIYYRSRCSALMSAYSCPLEFKTPCSKKTISHSFDDLDNCPTSCSSDCSVNGFWHNVSDDDTDWIVHQGATPTDFTGPDNDYFNFGKYLYIENSRNTCGIRPTATLASDCFLVTSDTTDCQLQFAYHMSGIDIETLQLEITEDDGLNWTSIFDRSGVQSDDWLLATVDLSNYLDKYCRLRFTATGSAGNFGDIAIDQIDFFVAQAVEGNRLFADLDGDGYGDAQEVISPCNSLIPSGYVANDLDCDDTDQTINPDGIEIPCNLLDENCNGLADDASQSNDLAYTINNINDETCPGSLDGFIQLDISGGSGNYTVNWNNGMSGETITGLTEGIYTGKIIDASGCKILIDFIEIDALESITIIATAILPASCFGIEDGSIAINNSGAFGPFRYDWSDGSQTKDLSAATSGDYQVTVTDTRGCTAVSDAITIPSLPNLVTGIQLKQDVSCFGAADGSILIGASQGMAPYSFIWSTGHTSQEIDSLAPGSYTVSITDALGCMTTLEDIIITQPDSLIIQLDSREDISCPDNNDGRILISSLGGNSPITYKWSNGSITDDLFGLTPGLYSVTATDARSCEVVLEDIEILSPPPIEIVIDSVSEVPCSQSMTGHISLDVTGGRGAYFYSWSAGNDSENENTDLLPGFYNITVIDEFNCKASLNQIEIKAIDNPIPVTTSIIVDNSCYAEEEAIISATVDSDRLPIDYNWSAGQQSIIPSKNDTISSLPSGQYQLTVTDNEGCTGLSEVITLDSFEVFQANLVSKENILCYGDSTGSIDITIIGGAAPLLYSWTDEGLSLDRENLPAGSYQLSVRDDQDCIISSQIIEITSPDSLDVSASIEDASPNTSNGSITLDIQGGTPPYSILWQNGDSTLVHADLAPGTYIAEITDANGCNFTGEYFVDMLSSVDQVTSNHTFTVSPNPAKGSCRIEVEENISIKSIEIIDPLGNSIFPSWNIDRTTSEINLLLEGIASGVYIIRISTATNEFMSSKLIVLE